MPGCLSERDFAASSEPWYCSICCFTEFELNVNKNLKRAQVSEQPLPLIPSAPVELLSSLLYLEAPSGAA